MNAPKPSSTRFGGTVSRTACVSTFSAFALDPASATMRLSMSTNAPESGRSDQRVSAVTWNSTITPLPRRAAVTSGVPSASVAQVRSVRLELGSASTWRVTVTSVGTVMPLNGLSRAKAASCCGCSQESEPPSVRPPRRSFTGMRSSSAAASRGPAKRTSTPPSSTHRASFSRASPATLPTSARISIGRFCARNCCTACAGEPRSASRTSANGLSARDR